ncbi:phage tail protein [Pseudomonas koreensis]|uniref:Phage tail protein n=1 Tax=Pseudomonas koreensis TaxID=198620 RepID=A0A9X2XL37_9PSED|nr:phage tail protein [Pseudomonas koreensis]MCU7250761.1 phage tail protein [Pseudomonas koreensis]
MADYYTLLTNAGIAYETACKAAGVPIKLTQISVGDGDDAVYNPAATATALKREVWRGPLNALFQDEKNPSWLLAEVTIPPDVGGWYVREAGLWTDTGILYAIVKYPESFKPVLATSGSGKEFYIRSIFETSNASLVTLLIDDTVVKATRAWVTGYVADELAKLDAKQSVRVATKTNIILSGAQTIDGVAVVAGDRVLVKSQVQAKDNGIYVAANDVWARAKDADLSVKVTPNLLVAVEVGTTLADTIWQLITDAPIVLGTTPLTFQNVTAGYAPLVSPAFDGAPTCPTPAQFDGSQLLVNAEFVRRHGLQYSSFKSVGTSYVVTLADIGGLVSLSNAGPISCTLPATSSIPASAPAVITIVGAGVGAVSVLPAAGGDTINTSTGVVGPIVLGLGDTAEFIRLGGQWRLIGGTAAIRYASIMDDPVFTTQPQFDNSKALATTEYVKTASGNMKGLVLISANTVLTPAQVGSFVSSNVGTGNVNVGLPLISSVAAGSMFVISHSSSAMTSFSVTTSSGTDLLVWAGLGLGQTLYTLAGDETIVVVSTGAAWKIIGGNGSRVLNLGGAFGAMFGASGYQKLPSGLIMQWGSVTTTTSGTSVVFPIAFPSAVLSLCGSVSNNDSSGNSVFSVFSRSGLGTTGFTAWTKAAATTRVSDTVQWIAVGN